MTSVSGGNNFIDFLHQGCQLESLGVYTPLGGSASKPHQGGVNLSQGSAPDPAGGAYSATPDPLAGFKGPYF